LNRCKSADNRHGNSPPRPITPFSATATMMEIRIESTAWDGLNLTQRREGAKEDKKILEPPRTPRLRTFSFSLALLASLAV
jgi:hypothetical protein